MKYQISEQQNERIFDIIKNVAEQYTNDNIVKTEVVVSATTDAGGDVYYVLYPTFYVKGGMGPDFHIWRHNLAQYVEDVLGFPVHARSARLLHVFDV